MSENLKPADIHVKDSKKNRIFLSFSRNVIAQQYPKYTAERIEVALGEMIARQPVKVELVPHQFSVVPRIHNAPEGQCNWQVVVFLPIPADALTALNLATSDLQKRCNMIDEYQGTTAVIV